MFTKHCDVQVVDAFAYLGRLMLLACVRQPTVRDSA